MRPPKTFCLRAAGPAGGRGHCTCSRAPRSFVTRRCAEKGRGQPAPRPASSAAAVGMETSTPRTGSQLAQTAARHSASSRGEAPRVSSRDELAEMAAASQGKGGRGPPWRREEPPSRAPERDRLRSSQARPRPPPREARAAKGWGRALELGPGPAKVSGRAGADLFRGVGAGQAPLPSGPAPATWAWQLMVCVLGSGREPRDFRRVILCASCPSWRFDGFESGDRIRFFEIVSSLHSQESQKKTKNRVPVIKYTVDQVFLLLVPL